jgi:hypothetical protein
MVGLVYYRRTDYTERSWIWKEDGAGKMRNRLPVSIGMVWDGEGNHWNTGRKVQII